MILEEEIRARLSVIRENIHNYAKEEVQLIAVTKKQRIEKLRILSKLGICDFGENYIQELEGKKRVFSNIRWHYLGRIQSNKLKKILFFSDVIHSVSSVRQIEKMEQYARELRKKTSLYLQLNLTREEQKAGVFIEDLEEVLFCLSKSQFLKPLGFMCMSSREQSLEEKRLVFRFASDLLKKWGRRYSYLCGLSMGMSDDYSLALLEGSTCLRLGEALLGKRAG